MTTIRESQCYSCARRWRLIDTDDAYAALPTQICEAFPEGIPDAVMQMRVDHRNPIQGDQGLRWEPREGATYPEFALRSDDDASAPA